MFKNLIDDKILKTDYYIRMKNSIKSLYIYFIYSIYIFILKMKFSI